MDPSSPYGVPWLRYNLWYRIGPYGSYRIDTMLVAGYKLATPVAKTSRNLSVAAFPGAGSLVAARQLTQAQEL
jgi:hypothetical protein